jgi:tRNA (guanine37-N1)-methyltransferase
MLKVYIISVFPEFFASSFSVSLLKRAIDEGLVSVECLGLREFTDDPHRKVDDYPFGGGAGMVLKPEPIFRAMDILEDKLGEKREIILLSARGVPFDQETAVRLSIMDSLVLICGRYKDVDERVRERLVTSEISIGDYVLSGGEPAALAVIDAVVRLLPGVMGDFESAQEDSFYDGLLSAPVYTRPREYRGMMVPDLLIRGDHREIRQWRHEQSVRLTRERRPDLWETYAKNHPLEEEGE